ncbi:MAG: ribonuclease III [Sandaracinus sp.]|nr:ribonuclease III [Sandaracinus sp.]MCB9631443.1 ribonuclease III [Sandaracinus sp.]MCB9637208.1 ribonuclease III [Sandaracinus sp.]
MALGHAFERPELLREALTHRSYRNERPRLAPSDNERLEFLGDAFLGMCVGKLLFDAEPDAREGELTRKRADLVCEGSLATIATELGVGPALRLGKGEDRSGGRDKPRLLASAFEALVGAVIADAGVARAWEVVAALFGPRLETATAERDHKSRVQELLQAAHGRTPTYRLVRADGPDHERTFFVELVLGDDVLATGSGRSKAEAEQVAAKAALEDLE